MLPITGPVRASLRASCRETATSSRDGDSNTPVRFRIAANSFSSKVIFFFTDCLTTCYTCATLLSMANRTKDQSRRAGYPWLVMGRRNFRISEIARRAGMPVSTVYRIFMADEGSRTRPRLDTMSRIARSCGVTLDDVSNAIIESRKLVYKKQVAIHAEDDE